MKLFKSKRFFCIVLTVLFLLAPLTALSTVSAAQAPIRVIGYDMSKFDGGKQFYLSFFLDTNIGNARHLQTQEKKQEPDLPADSWDFDALLTDAGRNCVLVNDVCIGDYLDATGGVWSPSLHFEKAERYQNRQTFTMEINGIPGIKDAGWKKTDFSVEVTDGMISREHWKFEPFIAKWNAKAQKLTIYRENDDGLTLEQALAGAKPTTTKANSGNATTTKADSGKATTTKANVGTVTTTVSAGDTDETTLPSDETETTVSGDTASTAPVEEEVIPTLGSFDITSKSKEIVINFPDKVITLSKSMTVKEFLGQLEAVKGYQLGVYNGSTAIAEGNAIVEGYKFKVRYNDKLIGNFLLKAPAASSNTWIVVLCIVGGAVVLAGAGVLVYLFVIRKHKKA